MTSRMTGAVAVCLLAFATETHAGDVVDYAASLIGRPYVWGAEGPNSFDCSGLTQYVYRKFGVDLPRRAISQSRIGDRAGDQLQRGDLLFFATDSDESLVTHVGLYEGSGIMIDASKRGGEVRRDDLSDRFWVDRFLFARRVRDAGLPDRPDLPKPANDKRRLAVEVLERTVGVLLRRPIIH